MPKSQGKAEHIPRATGLIVHPLPLVIIPRTAHRGSQTSGEGERLLPREGVRHIELVGYIVRSIMPIGGKVLQLSPIGRGRGKGCPIPVSP